MRLIARNPSDDLALPRIRRPEIKALTEGEIARMLATATGVPVAVASMRAISPSVSALISGRRIRGNARSSEGLRAISLMRTA